MNYFISGQSGFIGTAMTNHLLKKRELVYSIPRGQSIYQLRSLFWFNNPDYIIHLASYGNHYHQKDFAETVNANILGTYNILEAARSFGYKLFYNVSTSSVILKNQTQYSITKYCGEQLAGMYKNVINIRPYSVYGPGEASHRFIPTVIRHLKSGKSMNLDKNACHDWIYIDDFIEAMLNGSTEIGTGIKTKNIEVVSMLEDISGMKLNYQPARLREYDNEEWVCPDGVNYKIDLFTGLKKMYDSIK